MKLWELSPIELGWFELKRRGVSLGYFDHVWQARIAARRFYLR